ncbi:MAG: MFS transporter [bacterium]|nr:MFS transporter [bacterium]
METIKKDKNLKFIFRAFQYRNYRLFFGGQGISLIGTWMQQISLSWLVYRLTNSAFLLGVVGFSSNIPILLIEPFAGVLADRWNRRKILIVTQILSMLQALTLAILVLTGTIQVWHIILLGLFLGSINAFDIPARQSFIVEIVDKKEDLGNAIALNSTMFNSARLIGPSVAGILIAITGEGVCFLINAVSYLAVIFALLAMRLNIPKIKTKKSFIFQEIKEGFSYTVNSLPIKSIILLLGLVSFMGMSYTILMPIFAKKILHGGPHTLGFLMGAVGTGALVGAFYLASRKNIAGLGRIIPVATGIFSIGLISMSFSKVLWLSLILMSITGFGMIVQMASCNTVIQTIVDDNKRGRVMSFYIMAFMGTAPFGSLLAGALASKIGAPHTLTIGGTVCLIGSLIFASKIPALKKLHPEIY